MHFFDKKKANFECFEFLLLFVVDSKIYSENNTAVIVVFLSTSSIQPLCIVALPRLTACPLECDATSRGNYGNNSP